MPFTLLPLMTEFSVFMPLQSIAPGISWLGGVSLKDYKIVWKIKIREMKTKDFNCTMDKMDQHGENEIQRLYRCCSYYAVKVDNGLRIYGEGKT